MIKNRASKDARFFCGWTAVNFSRFFVIFCAFFAFFPCAKWSARPENSRFLGILGRFCPVRKGKQPEKSRKNPCFLRKKRKNDRSLKMFNRKFCRGSFLPEPAEVCTVNGKEHGDESYTAGRVCPPYGWIRWYGGADGRDGKPVPYGCGWERGVRVGGTSGRPPPTSAVFRRDGKAAPYGVSCRNWRKAVGRA